MDLQHVKLLLFSIFHIHFTQSKRPATSTSVCFSSRPCERLCPESPSSSKKDGRITPQALSSTVYCIMGKCFCPEKRVATEKCTSPTSAEKAACTIPLMVVMQVTKPVIGKDKTVQLCTIKGRMNPCTKRRNEDRTFCVYSIKTDPETGLTMVPGFTMPSMPTIPGGIIPGQNGGGKQKVGQENSNSGSGGGNPGEESLGTEDRGKDDKTDVHNGNNFVNKEL